MEPLEIIMSALVLGAGAALKTVTDQATKDIYEKFKGLFRSRYPTVDLALIEKNPASEKRRDVIIEELAEAGVTADKEILTQAQDIITLIQAKAPEVAQAVGLRMTDSFVENVRLGRLEIEGAGIGAEISKTRVPGSLSADEVTVRGFTPKKA